LHVYPASVAMTNSGRVSYWGDLAERCVAFADPMNVDKLRLGWVVLYRLAVAILIQVDGSSLVGARRQTSAPGADGPNNRCAMQT
jgi:hypothetical protein